MASSEGMHRLYRFPAHAGRFMQVLVFLPLSRVASIFRVKQHLIGCRVCDGVLWRRQSQLTPRLESPTRCIDSKYHYNLDPWYI